MVIIKLYPHVFNTKFLFSISNFPQKAKRKMWPRNAMVKNLGWLVPLFVVLGHNFLFVHGVCQKFAFFIDKDVVHDHALENHVFKRSTVNRATQCHMMCKDDCRCISMNFIYNNVEDNCELNSFNKEMKPAALKYKPGASYYDLVREYTTGVSDVPAFRFF